MKLCSDYISRSSSSSFDDENAHLTLAKHPRGRDDCRQSSNVNSRFMLLLPMKSGSTVCVPLYSTLVLAVTPTPPPHVRGPFTFLKEHLHKQLTQVCLVTLSFFYVRKQNPWDIPTSTTSCSSSLVPLPPPPPAPPMVHLCCLPLYVHNGLN